MPFFTYSAHGSDGKIQEGTIDALSLQAAREALREMRLEPDTIEEKALAGQEFPPMPFERESTAAPDAPSTTPTEVSFSPVAPPPELPSADTPAEPLYFPLLDTLRLYAGWLVAWYFLVYAVGSYQYQRSLPFSIPYVEGLFLSPLVLSFTLAAYLFLVLTGIHRKGHGGFLSGLLLAFVGVAVFLLYRRNVL
ncbi:MAG: hypothetical protein PHI23_00085 [Candidatus Peribacteraceae bacterium]|nr:hypothetical protein [Candidatus Peribacteraceae bacterium]